MRKDKSLELGDDLEDMGILYCNFCAKRAEFICGNCEEAAYCSL